MLAYSIPGASRRRCSGSRRARATAWARTGWGPPRHDPLPLIAAPPVFSSDGKRLAAALVDGRAVKMWDAATGEEVSSFKEAGEELYALALSRDGKKGTIIGVEPKEDAVSKDKIVLSREDSRAIRNAYPARLSCLNLIKASLATWRTDPRPGTANHCASRCKSFSRSTLVRFVPRARLDIVGNPMWGTGEVVAGLGQRIGRRSST